MCCFGSVRQSRSGKLPNGVNHIFCTQIFTISGIFFRVKLSECQCKKYTKISAFSKSKNFHNMKYFHIKNLK